MIQKETIITIFSKNKNGEFTTTEIKLIFHDDVYHQYVNSILKTNPDNDNFLKYLYKIELKKELFDAEGEQIGEAKILNSTKLYSNELMTH